MTMYDLGQSTALEKLALAPPRGFWGDWANQALWGAPAAAVIGGAAASPEHRLEGVGKALAIDSALLGLSVAGQHYGPDAWRKLKTLAAHLVKKGSARDTLVKFLQGPHGPVITQHILRGSTGAALGALLAPKDRKRGAVAGALTAIVGGESLRRSPDFHKLILKLVKKG